MNIVRTEEEIDQVLEAAMEADIEGSKYPGETYENGIKAMYEWLTGLIDSNPME